MRNLWLPKKKKKNRTNLLLRHDMIEPLISTEHDKLLTHISDLQLIQLQISETNSVGIRLLLYFCVSDIYFEITDHRLYHHSCYFVFFYFSVDSSCIYVMRERSMQLFFTRSLFLLQGASEFILFNLNISLSIIFLNFPYFSSMISELLLLK